MIVRLVVGGLTYWVGSEICSQTSRPLYAWSYPLSWDISYRKGWFRSVQHFFIFANVKLFILLISWVIWSAPNGNRTIHPEYKAILQCQVQALSLPLLFPATDLSALETIYTNTTNCLFLFKMALYLHLCMYMLFWNRKGRWLHVYITEKTNTGRSSKLKLRDETLADHERIHKRAHFILWLSVMTSWWQTTTKQSSITR